MLSDVATLGRVSRADWDWSERSAPMTEASLRHLAAARDPTERAGIVARLTRYLEPFPPEEVNFLLVNQAFADAGFPPLPFTPEVVVRRPMAEMDPELAAGFGRLETLRRHASGRLGAKLISFVRDRCGDALTQEEFAEAMRALRSLPKG